MLKLIPKLIPKMSRDKFFFQLILLPALIYLSVLYFPVLQAKGQEARGQSGQILGVISSKERALPHIQEQFGLLARVGPPLKEEPVSRNGAIIIEKIGVNSPIAWDVGVASKTEYKAALDKGVAHARGTDHPKDLPEYPTQSAARASDIKNNIYLFAHSVANEAWIARYAAVFTKLDELTTGDRIVVFEAGKRYDYEVAKTEVVPSFDTTVITRTFDQPTLTLQTCHPRGMPRDRFIVTAHLVGVYEK